MQPVKQTITNAQVNDTIFCLHYLTQPEVRHSSNEMCLMRQWRREITLVAWYDVTRQGYASSGHIDEGCLDDVIVTANLAAS